MNNIKNDCHNKIKKENNDDKAITIIIIHRNSEMNFRLMSKRKAVNSTP